MKNISNIRAFKFRDYGHMINNVGEQSGVHDKK